MPPHPIARLWINIIIGLTTRLVCNYLSWLLDAVFYIIMINVDQIYYYLLKLKLNLRIGPNSNLKKKKKTLSMVTKINVFTLSKKITFHLLEKQLPLHQKTNGLAVPNKNKKCHSHVTNVPKGISQA